MSLKPWREIAIPHEDVLRGTFQQAEFAADISRVHAGTATDEYQNPALFFERTFITEGMRLLLDSVVKRLTGRGGDPVIQLQTAFGGGKTHTMLAVYHLAKGDAPASQLQGIPPILDSAGITELPKARIVVIDGIRLSPSQPKQRGGVLVHTLWGELAWQIGGEAAYARVRDSDLSGTSPGKEVLIQLIADHAPCVILIDELVAYVRQFEDGKSFTGGTYDSNLSFVQALTEAMKAVPTAVLLASLPESDKEAGSQKGINALAALSHYFGRVQALWKPVAAEEAFEIVRRRLFTTINDRLAAEAVCRAYADLYIAHSGDFPAETQDSHYFTRLLQAYPLHPEVFDRLYEDWSSLDNFQRTRGVLKLMAKVIHRLWKDNNNDLLIQPASLPLYDADVRNESIYYLAQGWDPVVEKDIDGERAATTDLDTTRPIFGAIHACRRLARAIFLGSAPDAGNVGGAKHHRGLEQERLLLACAQPEQVLGHYKDALRAIVDKLQYLNSANSRYWFDTRPNLRREMEDRKRRFNDKEDVFPFVRDKLRFASGVFGGVHVFTNSGDIPDDWSLRLVLLTPDAPFSRSGQTSSAALTRATEILKHRGDQPRQKQNRPIFMAADMDTVSRLKDQVRSVLAWQSIVSDVKEGRLNLDMLQGKQASKSLEEARSALDRMVRESYKWLLVPMQVARPGKGISDITWEHFQINPATINRMQEIEQVLKDNELLIGDWAPIHLAKLLKTWFWKDDMPAVGALDLWHKSCAYLYLPRLLDSNVLRLTLAAGAVSRDFFGLAYGREGERYLGFQYGAPTTPILDDSLLLVEPKAAEAFDKVLQAEEEARKTTTAVQPGGHAVLTTGTGAVPAGVEKPPGPGYTLNPPKAAKRRLFFGTVELNPLQPKPQFGDVVDEIVMLLNRSDVRLKISVEIQAESESGFDESIQRAVRENCHQLKFRNGGFED
jgi:predicted AAA+ superfamily ATPase